MSGLKKLKVVSDSIKRTNLLSDPVRLPENGRCIGLKWVCKKKRNLDGLVERLPRDRVAVGPGVLALFATRDFLQMQARARKSKRGAHFLITQTVPGNQHTQSLHITSQTFILTNLCSRQRAN